MYLKTGTFLVLGSEQLPEINNDENNGPLFQIARYNLNISHMLFHSQRPFKVGSVISPILQMRHLRHREVK